MLATLTIAFSMSADAFAAALAKGAALHRPKLSEAVRTGLIFGCIETATPLLGWLLGIAGSAYVAAIDHWIAFALLAGIGGKMLVECFRKEADVERPRRHSLPALVLTAIGTSIDAFAVGVTLALLDADIVVTALAIGAATFTMTTLGVMIGRLVGTCLGRIATGFAGCLLIGIGALVVAEHMGWLGQT